VVCLFVDVLLDHGHANAMHCLHIFFFLVQNNGDVVGSRWVICNTKFSWLQEPGLKGKSMTNSTFIHPALKTRVQASELVFYGRKCVDGDKCFCFTGYE
jgi:hypothetical protein